MCDGLLRGGDWTTFLGREHDHGPKPCLSAIESASQNLEQQVMIEWLCQELDCTLFYGLSPQLGIVKRRNKDDRNFACLLFQSGLQLQPRHLRHADVNDQARCPAMRIGFEE